MLGLFLKFRDIAVLAHVHDAEAGGLLQGDLQHGDGAGGVLFQVLLEHLGVVHLIDVVAGEDQHVLGIVVLNEGQVLVDGVGGAGEPGALLMGAQVGRQDVHAAVGHVQIPGLAGSDVGVELEGLVLGQHAHGVDAGVCAVGQGKVDDAVFAAEGDAGLGHVLGQSIQAGALAACQKHGNTAFLHKQPPLCRFFVR